MKQNKCNLLKILMIFFAVCILGVIFFLIKTKYLNKNSNENISNTQENKDGVSNELLNNVKNYIANNNYSFKILNVSEAYDSKMGLTENKDVITLDYVKLETGKIKFNINNNWITDNRISENVKNLYFLYPEAGQNYEMILETDNKIYVSFIPIWNMSEEEFNSLTYQSIIMDEEIEKTYITNDIFVIETKNNKYTFNNSDTVKIISIDEYYKNMLEQKSTIGFTENDNVYQSPIILIDCSLYNIYSSNNKIYVKYQIYLPINIENETRANYYNIFISKDNYLYIINDYENEKSINIEPIDKIKNVKYINENEIEIILSNDEILHFINKNNN